MTALTYLRPTTPTWGAAKFGVSSLAATFARADGITPFLNADFSPPGTGTFEAWVRRSPSVTDLQVFMSNQNFWVAINGSGNLQCDKVSTTTDTAIGDGNWHHVALVFNAGSAALYCDGTKVSGDSVQGSYANASNLFNIGGLSEGNSSFDFDGDIDEVRLSTTARYTGPSYTVPTAAFTSDGTTAELWHLDDGTPPAPTPVTATAPTKNDEPGTSADTYTITATAGVEYRIGGVAKAAGTYPTDGASSVTITAHALTGYELTGTSSWTLTYSTTGPTPEPDPDHRYRLGFEPLVWDGDAYPPRHPGAASVTYIGPLEPAEWLPNDLWVRQP